MLVPILDEVITEAAEAGMRQAFIGMAHRGRLNVMAHVLGKPYEQILAEFKDPVRNSLAIEGVQWSGDVKYHLGASRMVDGGEAVALVVSMPPNPSHLEAIDRGDRRHGARRRDGSGRPGQPVFNPDAVLPILIHGDAAFSGQGVVAETLNLHRLDGYTTGGTIHIIANNQIGFTTAPHDAYSTLYASGLARAFKIPIVHVNADDPEACVAAARLAFGYREQFKRDFLIDLIGYRRYGHNEGDEPAFTQPMMYRKIAAQPTVRQVWARTLETRGTIPADRADAMLNERLDDLQKRLEALEPEKHYVETTPEIAAPGTAGPGQDGRARSSGCARSMRPCWRRPTGLPCIASSNGAARSDGGCSTIPTSRRSIGPPPRSWRAPRFSRTARRSGSPARTSSAARSVIATPSSTTRRRDSATRRSNRSRRRRRRTRFATARSARTRSSGSSTATTCRRPSGW